MYYKGANMLHNIRQMINDDEKWRQILRTLNNKFYHQTVSTYEIENCIAEESGLNLKGFFDQYLRTTKIPVLEYEYKGKTVTYKWKNIVKDFEMPLEVIINGESYKLNPSSKNQKLKVKEKITSFEIDRDYFVNASQLN